MVKHTAAFGGALAVAAGSALVVVPSATVTVTNASRRITTTTTASLSAVSARTFNVGPVNADAMVPATGVLPATSATGNVIIHYDRIGNLYVFGGLSFHCFFDWVSPGCRPDSPKAPQRITLLAGTRLLACAWPANTPTDPPCSVPATLVTTAPGELVMGSLSKPIPVRAVAAGPGGNLLLSSSIRFADSKRFVYYTPEVDAIVELDADMSGGGEAGRRAVTQADVDKATAAARDQLTTLLGNSAADRTEPGETLVTPLLNSVLTPRAPSRAVGEEAATVDVYVQATAQAVAVPTATLQHMAETAVSQASNGRHVLAGSIGFDPPKLQTGTGAGIELTAHALVTDLDSYAVRSSAAWHGAGHVDAEVRRISPHASVTVQHGFGWSPALVFLDRRVALTVDGYGN